ncbi:MAG TPA: hypothetical protein VHO47_04895 [Candidatus Babeliales bacterium]|nr:hypothetical protein [Candidatus Babeliales bacterium]
MNILFLAFIAFSFSTLCMENDSKKIVKTYQGRARLNTADVNKSATQLQPINTQAATNVVPKKTKVPKQVTFGLAKVIAEENNSKAVPEPKEDNKWVHFDDEISIAAHLLKPKNTFKISKKVTIAPQGLQFERDQDGKLQMQDGCFIVKEPKSGKTNLWLHGANEQVLINHVGQKGIHTVGNNMKVIIKPDTEARLVTTINKQEGKLTFYSLLPTNNSRLDAVSESYEISALESKGINKIIVGPDAHIKFRGAKSSSQKPMIFFTEQKQEKK